MEEIKQNTNSQTNIENNSWLKKFLMEIFDLATFLIFVMGIVFFVRFFIFNPYTVVGQSMEPTFHEKDFIIIDKISQKVDGFKRYDVIVFVPPGKDIPYIKRIIGLPGETVKIIDGYVYVCQGNSLSGNDCKKLDEPYLSPGQTTKATCGIDSFVIGSGSYFVLGDNRDHSTDSRCCFGFGCYNNASYTLPEKYIIGKVYIKVYPKFEKY